MQRSKHTIRIGLPLTALMGPMAMTALMTALMTLAFLLLPARSHAQGIEPTPFAPFGMLGLARAQTARLNLVNLLPQGGITPCVAVLSFADGDGMPLMTGTGAPIMERFSLLPGKAAFLDLTAREAFPRDSRELRMQFRGEVGSNPPDDNTPPPDDETPDPCAGLVATLEIFDMLTGRTAVLYALPPVGTNPPDDGAPR